MVVKENDKDVRLWFFSPPAKAPIFSTSQVLGCQVNVLTGARKANVWFLKVEVRNLGLL